MQKYNRNHPYINRQILKRIKEFGNKPNVKQTGEFVNDLFSSKFLCAMIPQGVSGNNEAFSPYLLNTANDELVLPVFTNELEVLKSNEDFVYFSETYTTYILDFQEVLQMYNSINKKIPITLVIDPQGSKFLLNGKMLSLAQSAFNEMNKH